jgi:uncharacterized protein YbjQ (UPF0145 family)
MVTIDFPLPAILTGESRKTFRCPEGYAAELAPEFGARLNAIRRKYRANKVGIVGVEKSARMEEGDLGRMLAKIAHSYAVAAAGETFEPLLTHIIRGWKPYFLPFYIGCQIVTQDQPSDLHEVSTFRSGLGGGRYARDDDGRHRRLQRRPSCVGDRHRRPNGRGTLGDDEPRLRAHQTADVHLGLTGSFLAAFKSFTRGEITELALLVHDAREIAIDRLKSEADQLGAEDVVGVKTYIAEIGHGLVEFIAIGTAVKRLRASASPHPPCRFRP